MFIIFIIPDGLNSSGLLTWALNHYKKSSNIRLVFLNLNSLPLNFSPNNDHFLNIRNSSSHKITYVANKILDFIYRNSFKETILVPLCGDTSFAVSNFVSNAINTHHLGFKTRIIAPVLGDQKNPYKLLVHYEKSISKFFGNSNHIYKKIKELLPHRQKDVFLWEPFINNPTNRIKKLHTSKLKIISVGRLDETTKCISRIPIIIKYLIKFNISFDFYIYGNGPDKDSILKNLKELKITNDSTIEYLGEVNNSEIHSIMNDKDIFVLTSKTEGLPYTLLESMSQAVCPIVMSIESGVNQVIKDGYNGFITDQGDCLSFASTIKELNYNRTLLGEICRNAQYSITQAFNYKKSFKQYTIPFKNALSNEPPSFEIIPYIYQKQIDYIVTCVSQIKSPYAIYGLGMFGRKLTDQLIDSNFTPDQIIDKTASTSFKSYRNIKVVSHINQLSPHINHVILGTIDFSDEIISIIKKFEETRNTLTINIISSR